MASQANRYFDTRTLLYYLHFMLMTSGYSSTEALIGVFIKRYAKVSQGEIGLLLITLPFMVMLTKPYFCYLADRYQAHRFVLAASLGLAAVAYSPALVIPFYPNFYLAHGRVSWWILAASCLVGTSAQSVAWSLGDSLAINAANRFNSSYGRMKIVSTINYGVYGYFLGRINDTPLLPMYVPGFIILLASFLIEVVLVLVWNSDAFTMGDAEDEVLRDSLDESRIASASVSLTASMKLDKQAGSILRDLLNTEDINTRLANLSEAKNESAKGSKMAHDCELCQPKQESYPQRKENTNLQLILLKLLVWEDLRFFKYLILYALIGFITSPFNFLFMSIEEATMTKPEYRFTELAGTIFIAQGFAESVAFLALSSLTCCESKFVRATFILVSLSARALYYGLYYYTSGGSLYWAMVPESLSGLTYGVYVYLMADLSIMFSRRGATFIPRLRKLGILSDPTVVGRAESLKEEARVRVALRATIQAAFAGAWEGLGFGLGSLMCGLTYEMFGYIIMWRMVAGVAMAGLFFYLTIDLSKSRFSDFNSRYAQNQPTAESKLDSELTCTA